MGTKLLKGKVKHTYQEDFSFDNASLFYMLVSFIYCSTYCCFMVLFIVALFAVPNISTK